MLPPQGESLLSLAQQLGMRVFGRHAVRRQRRSSRVQALQERYYQYVRLLASDTQVSLRGPLPGWGWGAAGVFPGADTEAWRAGPCSVRGSWVCLPPGPWHFLIGSCARAGWGIGLSWATPHSLRHSPTPGGGAPAATAVLGGAGAA